MGNINVMGEAITQHQLVQQVLLQNRILDRQRLFGMKPVLPGCVLVAVWPPQVPI